MTHSSKGPYKLEVSIKGLPATYNVIGMKSRWVRKRNTDEWKLRVYSAVKDLLPPEPLAKARCTLIRHSSHAPDFEALVLAAKPILDGLVEAGVLVDDNMECIGKPDYLWAEAPRDKGFISILVKEVSGLRP